MKNEIKEILEFDFQSQGERIEINEYERDILKDYITNLQEENESLKRKISFNEKSRRKMQQSLMEKIENYKSRNEKAIEYIKEWQSFPHTNGSTHRELQNLSNILKGE